MGEEGWRLRYSPGGMDRLALDYYSFMGQFLALPLA